jgi:hypothetical protein
MAQCWCRGIKRISVQRKSLLCQPQCYTGFKCVFHHKDITTLSSLQRSEQSRRDDMESLAYVLIYLLRKDGMPWDPFMTFLDLPHPLITVTPSTIASCKEQSSPEDLCEDLPPLFARFLTHARSLEFDEKPDYESFMQAFEELAKELRITTPYLSPVLFHYIVFLKL